MQYVQKFRQWPYLPPFWSAPRFVSPSLCVWGSSPIPAPWFSCSGEIETPCSTGYSRFSQSQTWQSTSAVECFGVCQGKIQKVIYCLLEASLEADPSVQSLLTQSNVSLMIRRTNVSVLKLICRLCGSYFESSIYRRLIFPIIPALIPISHMAVMTSNFCTGVMGFERYVRFKV